MAAKIRLKRVGAKNQPLYRVVVQDESAPRKGLSVEVLGQYNPLAEPTVFEVDKEKTLEWIKKGAKPTEKVRILLGKAGILPPVSFEGKKKRLPKIKAKEEAKPEVAEKKEAEKPAGEEKKAEEEKKEEAKKEEKKEEGKKEEKAKEEKAGAEVPKGEETQK